MNKIIRNALIMLLSIVVLGFLGFLITKLISAQLPIVIKGVYNFAPDMIVQYHIISRAVWILVYFVLLLIYCGLFHKLFSVSFAKMFAFILLMVLFAYLISVGFELGSAYWFKNIFNF